MAACSIEPVVMLQAEGEDLLFNLFEGEFMVVSHPDKLLDLFIFICRDMDW